MKDIPTNPIAKITDPVKRKQVTEIMKRIKELNTIDKTVNLCHLNITNMNDPRIEKLNLLGKEMLKYILDNSPDATDTIESYGYLRGARDTAFEMGVMSFTTLYDDLLKASEYMITNKGNFIGK